MLICVGIGSFSSDCTALSYGHWNYKSRLKGQAISELENIPKLYAICVVIYLLYSSDINIYASIYLNYVVKTKLFMSVNFRVISLIISTTDYNIIISLIFTIRVISLIISTTYYNIIISLIFTIRVISLIIYTTYYNIIISLILNSFFQSYYDWNSYLKIFCLILNSKVIFLKFPFSDFNRY